MVRQDLTVNRMTERELRRLPEPEAAAIADAYRQHPQLMHRAPRVRACHLLLRCTPENRLEVEERLQGLRLRAAVEDFALLAREHSQCPSAQRGGDLGYFKPGTMVKGFEEAAFSQAVGEVGGIVETPFGLHLIKVLAREEGEPRSLEEASDDIRALLKEQAAARHLQSWVGELRAAARIDYPG
jgi:peptidyl-prolyl cis-trans isomerase C